jgi:hypothetical protein
MSVITGGIRRGSRWSWLSLAIVVAMTALSAASPADTLAASACPSSPALAPGNQNNSTAAVLYCGGTYSDAWTAEDETDWIAFYTTQRNATVVAHYLATAQGTGHGVYAEFLDPGSSEGQTNELAGGPTSGGNQEPQGIAHTFETPGLHYIQMRLPCCGGKAQGVSYQLTLTGEWSQTALVGVAPQRTPPTTCPPSAALSPGSQDSSSTAVLYCGGTYSDAWTAEDETDWIAFYTTQRNATVVAHYLATAQGTGHGVYAEFLDPGSSEGQTNELAGGPTSGGNQEPQGIAHTFETPGLHYIQMRLPCCGGKAQGVSYQLTLTGEWSQTAPPPASPPSSSPPPPPSCVVPHVGRRMRLSTVKRRIRANHCRVGLVRYVHRRRTARGFVLALNPTPGTRLVNGAQVAVLVSSGPLQRKHAHHF